MNVITLDKSKEKILDEIPTIRDFSSFYIFLLESKSDSEFLDILDQLSGLSDQTLSEWLNISVKTFRNYKKNPDLVLKENTKEHVISLISLYKHGIEVFGDKERFELWLKAKNLLMDNTAPLDYLETISGIRWVDNRLTAIEFGDNI